MASVQERAGLESAPPHSPPRFSCFDGLRAMAATAVVVHHVGFQTGASYRYRTVGAYLARLGAWGFQVNPLWRLFFAGVPGRVHNVQQLHMGGVGAGPDRRVDARELIRRDAGGGEALQALGVGFL